MLTMDLLSEVDRMQDQMNRLFGSRGRPAADAPAVNVAASENGLRITADLPGVSASNVDITLDGSTLTIQGERPDPALNEGEAWARRERPGGAFARTLQLPFEADPDRVEARFENGVLTLTVPAPESAKPRKIAVRSA